MNKRILKINIQNKGAALLLFVVFFLAASSVLVYGLSRGVYSDILQYRALVSSKAAFFASDGGVEDIIYRFRNGKSYSASETFSLNQETVDVSVTNLVDHYEFDVSATSGVYVRKTFLSLLIGEGTSFGFGLQSGNGGITLENSSEVIGNVFSNGPIIGSGNLIRGDVTSAGSSGLIQGIIATGTARAHTIQNSTIENTSNPSAIKNEAYYDTTITATLVNSHTCPDGGVDCFPGSTDKPPAAMPITIADIEEREDLAAAVAEIPVSSCSGGVPTGIYVVDSDETLGPVKIPCNLHVEKNATILTISGDIWVVGNITTQNGPSFAIDASMTGEDFYVIADDRSNRNTSGTISIQGSTGFVGAGENSYVGIVSANNGNGGTVNSIDIDNNTPDDKREVVYMAPEGILSGRNSLELRAAVADKIVLQQSATVTFDDGLKDPNFTGTGGGYEIITWEEAQ